MESDLYKEIQRIRKDIIEGRFVNEATVSQGILLPLLRILGWPVFNTRIVFPEYGLEDKRVDYALCHPAENPIVFIEVKRLGRSEGADKQLFSYTNVKGIQMALLTDGQEWSFYVPGMPGGFEERCIYKLDLVERDIQESVKRLERYLEYGRVCRGEALEDAKKDYNDEANFKVMQEALPKAWSKLLEEQESLLVDLVAETVEDLCGHKPEPDMAGDFLKKQLKKGPAAPHKQVSEGYLMQDTNSSRKPTRRTGERTKRVEYGFKIKGEYFSANSNRDVLIKVIEELHNRYPGFLERFKSCPHGRRRRYVADTKEELYPGRTDLCKLYSKKLSSGDWISVNYSAKYIKKILKLAVEVAGLVLGVDLIVYLDVS